MYIPPLPSPIETQSLFCTSVSLFFFFFCIEGYHYHPFKFHIYALVYCIDARVGCSERIALKQVYYQGWNRSPAQVGCMRQVLRAGAVGRPREMGWGGRQEGRSGWGTHVNPLLIHVNIWQKPLQYCKVISLQLIKINEKKLYSYWPQVLLKLLIFSSYWKSWLKNSLQIKKKKFKLKNK